MVVREEETGVDETRQNHTCQTSLDRCHGILSTVRRSISCVSRDDHPEVCPLMSRAASRIAGKTRSGVDQVVRSMNSTASLTCPFGVVCGEEDLTGSRIP